jgi:hypothetical protein
VIIPASFQKSYGEDNYGEIRFALGVGETKRSLTACTFSMAKLIEIQQKWKQTATKHRKCGVCFRGTQAGYIQYLLGLNEMLLV